MSVHNGAKMGDIAETILLPGDPMRAKYIADNFLEDVVCYNEVRGMYGYTGTYKGKRISVQGTGMGVPSISIYVTELIKEYGVKNLIRIGTCGALREDVKVRDVVLAMSSSTDSSLNKVRFDGMDFAPCADFDLLMTAHKYAQEKEKNIKVGNVLCSDFFYYDDHKKDVWKLWAKYGVMAVDMESSALYTIAAYYGKRALTILTVSDSLVTGEATSPEERQTTLNDMIEIGLNTGISL